MYYNLQKLMFWMFDTSRNSKYPLVYEIVIIQTDRILKHQKKKKKNIKPHSLVKCVLMPCKSCPWCAKFEFDTAQGMFHLATKQHTPCHRT